MKHGFSKMIFLGAIAAWKLSAAAVPISGDNTGTIPIGNPAYLGVNFVTPVGGSWNNLTFNFFSGTVPYAGDGTLYLLSSNYTGLPTTAALSADPALLASTSTLVAGPGGSGLEWQFASGVTVAANTQYYVFEDVLLPSTISGLGTGGGGIGFTGSENIYFSSEDDLVFTLLTPGLFINYNFSGTLVGGGGTGVPEPTTLLLMAPALLLVLRRRLTR